MAHWYLARLARFLPLALGPLTACGSATTEPQQPAPKQETKPGEVPWAEDHDPSERTTRDVLPEPKSHDPPIDPGDDPALVETRQGGSCSGTAPAKLQAEVQARAGKTNDCYDELLERKQGVEGKVRVHLVIGEDGHPSKVLLVRNDLVDDTFGACIRDRFDAPFRTSPNGGCVSVAVPLQFTPEQAQEGSPAEAPEQTEEERAD